MSFADKTEYPTVDGKVMLPHKSLRQIFIDNNTPVDIRKAYSRRGGLMNLARIVSAERRRFVAC